MGELKAVAELNARMLALARSDLAVARDALKEAQRQLEELRTQLTRPAASFTDTFPPEGAIEDRPGAYLVDAPLGTLALEPGGGLRVQLHSKQPLDRNGNRRRSELGLWEPGATTRIFRRTPHGERWAWIYRFTPVALPPKLGKLVVVQWHAGKSDPGEVLSRNPPLSLELHGDKGLARVVLLWNENAIQAGNENRTTIFEAPIQPDADYTFGVEAVFRPDGQGRLLIGWDGNIVVDRQGPNCYNDQEAFVYNRFGIYAPNATVEDVPPVTAEVLFRRWTVFQPTGPFKPHLMTF